MKKFLDDIYEKISHFRVFEWTVFKVCLIVFGIILGTYFCEFFLQYIKIVWMVFLVFFIFTIYLLFIKNYDNYSKERGKNNE